jgi:hypothetical protein
MINQADETVSQKDIEIGRQPGIIGADGLDGFMVKP